MILAEPIAVTLEVAAVLDELEVEYLVGGSLASSVHGIPRSTNDLDLVVDLPGRLVAALVERLAPRFYVDKDMIEDAIGRRASFNIVHLETFVNDKKRLAARLGDLSETSGLARLVPSHGGIVSSDASVALQQAARGI